MFTKHFYIFKSFYQHFGLQVFKVEVDHVWSGIVSGIEVIKFQVKYIIQNWIYSTNHKRISINYFWFVLLAGVVGMVLATIIRVEMAYPGVGILAGDNSQYLSIVTAHGVIMVFFMAMPMLFGFFTNFLLPTQLGVHDVAFPRMNSAAFWFLPASLIILCQLVCIDRRYQRMNCFSVRELQSLVRNRFFYEQTPVTSFHKSMEKTLLSLRYKSSNSTLLGNHSGLSSSVFFPKSLTSTKGFSFVSESGTANSGFEYVFYSSYSNNPLNIDKNLPSKVKEYLSSLEPVTILTNLRAVTQNWLYTFCSTPFGVAPGTLDIRQTFHSSGNRVHHFNLLNFFEGLSYSDFYKTLQSEESSNKRFLLSDDPDLKYKVRTGNYLPERPFLDNNQHFLTTVLAKTVTTKNKVFFLNDRFTATLNSRFLTLKPSLGFKMSPNFDYTKTTSNSRYTQNWDIFFYALPYRVKNKTYFYSHSFVDWSRMGSKFTKMFLTQAWQAETVNNWRFLKLNREGWRCRMLLARNQWSLYKRVSSENNLVLLVEKNAKDLLPGWAMITPFSSRTKYTLVGKTDIGILVVIITLVASMVSCSNFLITYRYLSTLNNRKMRDARSFFSESIIVTCWMTLAANPMLILGLMMLISDRHWKTSFFDYSGGGDTVLFQHMFWFFGHPEVYIIIVPCFGFVNTILSFYLRKRISARASLMYSMYTIAFLGFFVWGHHMYMVGLSHTTRMLYSTLTVMISVPAATKIMHWLVTFINSSLHLELPLLFAITFIFFFLSGGISGMAVAHTGMDVLFHDTFYVIGHFHVMLSGSLMFAGFGAFYFYLPSIFGVRYNRLFAYLHFIYYLIGQLFTVIPMMWLGYSGMPRRVLDYPAALGGWHSLSTSAHMLSVAGILCFVLMLFDSLRKRKPYIIKTYGVGRYNTRLNFYLYEVSKSKYWVYKTNSLVSRRNSLKSDRFMFSDNYLITYTFKPKM